MNFTFGLSIMRTVLENRKLLVNKQIVVLKTIFSDTKLSENFHPPEVSLTQNFNAA